jgi:hypothetical protein
MQESEVIIVDGIPKDVYDKIVTESVNYAIVSLPFTINRMGIGRVKQRVLNIAKGRIAEGLFRYFCEQNQLAADFETCSTPWWKADKRDFLYQGLEWDLKNNFIYKWRKDDAIRYTDLPALVPNRCLPQQGNILHSDQWYNRHHKKFDSSSGVAFLFTFLQEADLLDGRRKNHFLEIYLTKEQLSLLEELAKKFGGKQQDKEPYSDDKFWDAMQKRGGERYFVLHDRPNLVITGYATQEHWDLFRDTGPSGRDNHFINHLPAGWYTKNNDGACNFMNHTLRTRIANATVPVSYLPSFLSLIHQSQMV